MTSPTRFGVAFDEFIDAAAVGRLGRLQRVSADAGCVLSISAATQFAWWHPLSDPAVSVSVSRTWTTLAIPP
jgi:hypothetical protein